jgi:hypothetical protein
MPFNIKRGTIHARIVPRLYNNDIKTVKTDKIYFKSSIFPDSIHWQNTAI